MALKVALVGGPMYDHLYERFEGRDIEVVVHEDHPTLNRRVAAMLADGERIDVLSTHSKYAPSQAGWLRPLDGAIDVTDLAPKAVELCTFRGDLLSIPRCIDVRVLWVNTDRVSTIPATWRDLVASDIVFGFPGRESGLFGTFFEIVRSHRGRLFDDDGRPTMATKAAERAVAMLCDLARRAPADLVEWHYDQVDEALLDGRIDAAAAWPGGYGPIRGSGMPLEPHPYPGGISYAGVHSWAIPTTCEDVGAATALITELTGASAAALDAAGGTIPANDTAAAAIRPDDGIDERRLQITRATIAGGMITYPPLVAFPEVEDAGWQAINAALRGEITPREAVLATQHAAEEALA